MFEEKLDEAREVLNKAVVMLIKESYVNSYIDGEKIPLPDHVNDVEVLNEILDIQDKLSDLQSRANTLAIG